VASTPQQLPTFMRKYKIEVSLPDSTELLTITDSDFEPEALRATFDIYTPAWRAYWYAEICLYNLDQLTTSKLLAKPIKQGMKVTVSAGYREGNYGVIWSGEVFQPFFDRENVVDFKVTLHCILGLNEFIRNHISQSYAAQTTQYDLIQQMADKAFNKIKVGAISPDISKKKFPRGGVLFGNLDRYLSSWASDNNMQWWLSPSGLNFQGPDSQLSSSVDFVYSPDRGIIGVPQQTQYGVDLRVLLDPRITVRPPLPVVKIDNSQIQLQKRQIGELFNILDQDGEYIVVSARHYGDTRGNDWYTDIQGLTSTGGKLAMIQSLAGEGGDVPLLNTPGT
jgi:hypothetical protein